MATKSKSGKPGVIDTIIEVISTEKGGSIHEIVAILTKRFPDRDETGMENTARLQANKNCTSKERIDGRGLVYHRRGRKAP